MPGNCFRSSCPPQSHLRAQRAAGPGGLELWCPPQQLDSLALRGHFAASVLAQVGVRPSSSSSCVPWKFTPWLPLPRGHLGPVQSFPWEPLETQSQALARLVQPHAFSPQPSVSPRDGCPGASWRQGDSCPSLLQDEWMATKVLGSGWAGRGQRRTHREEQRQPW